MPGFRLFRGRLALGRNATPGRLARRPPSLRHGLELRWMPAAHRRAD